MYLFIIWCASIAADEKTYLAAANSVAEAIGTIPSWYRQDFTVKYATLDQAIDYGAKYYGGDIVVFEDKFFEYNTKTNKLEYDSNVNHCIHSNL
jgi:hypothetical protein